MIRRDLEALGLVPWSVKFEEMVEGAVEWIVLNLRYGFRWKESSGEEGVGVGETSESAD